MHICIVILTERQRMANAPLNGSGAVTAGEEFDEQAIRWAAVDDTPAWGQLG
jgi:hypothetical protein